MISTLNRHLITYDVENVSTVPVYVSNVTTRTVTVYPHATLCEIQPVTVQNLPVASISTNDLSKLDKINLPTDELSAQQHKDIRSLLTDFEDIFSSSDTDIGFYPSVEHRIELTDETPFKQRYRRIPPSMLDEVRDHVQQQLSAGIIRRSHSPFSSNVVLVRKKNGQLRICIDYRHLNSRTKKDNYALPRIDEILDSLAGNNTFSVLDMKSGYHQIPIAEEHKERTAFTVGPLGFFEYNRMAMGLVNAPATYQRLMEECLGDLHHRICLIYLDDIIIFAKSFQEHQERLRQVLQRLRDCGIKLSPGKCALCMKRVKYVGHIVSETGIEPDEEKTRKVQEWPQPKTSEEVRKFLGFAGYYRKFIQNFSRIARPLTDLIPTTSRTKNKKKKNVPEWRWGKEQEDAFQTLKSCLVSPPVLAYPDFDLPFEVHTDASFHGLGAVLYQTQGGLQRVIAYASRGLNKSERNYPAHKLEFLALKWAVTEKFYDYLYGKDFTVVTDNNPLTYVLSSAKLDATGHRWVAALAALNFDIRYRPGRNNADGDSMSRLPELLQQEHIPAETIKTLCSIQPTGPYIESLSMEPDVTQPLEYCQQIRPIDVRRMQHTDPILRDWIYFVDKQRMPKSDELPPIPESTAFRKNFNKFRIIDGTLYREVTSDNGLIQQLVVPPSLVHEVLRQSHNTMGHPGRDKTTSFIRDRFFWPGMTNDIEQWIQRCKRCLLRKTPTNIRAPLTNIVTTQPLELVCMDYLQLEKSKGGYQYILVVTDHFTRYAIAIPTRNQTAKTTAEAFFNNFVVHYGLPKRIHSDQGASFESKIIRELCIITGMDKSRTTPYHPMGNGLTERFNRTLLGMLGTLSTEQKQNWKMYIAPLVHAYNSMRQDTTGQSPFYLMFGRQPRLPVDLAFGTATDNNTKHKSMTQYISHMKDRLRKSYEIAQKATQKSQERQKDNYDVKIRGGKVEVGDRVLVKIVAFEGRHKLSNKWEDEPYVVLRQPNPDIPVYVVRKESGEGRKRTLHRNLLLPIGFLNACDLPSDTSPKKSAQPKKVSKSRVIRDDRGESTVDTDVPDNTSQVSESETDFISVRVPRPRTVDSRDGHHDRTGDDQHDMSGQEAESERDASANHTSTGDVEVISTPDVLTDDIPPAIHIDSSHDVSESIETTYGADAEIEMSDTQQTTGTQPEVDDTAAEPDNDTPEPNTDTPEPEPEPSRPTRAQRPPAWMRDGDFVVSSVLVDDWTKRAEYLKSLAATDIFKGRESEICRAMIDIAFEKK